jgi:hypothetical protein
MFDFFKKDQTKSGNHQEQTTALVLSEHTGNTMVFLSDEVDGDLWYDLAPHIKTLVLRLSDVFEWKYDRYPTPAIRDRSQHEAFVSDLQKALLFIPCTSATFLTRFWMAGKIDARLKPLLAQTSVQPIPLRVAHGVSQSMLAKPLAAYPTGHARDEACVQGVATLEQKVLSYQSRQGNTNVQAPIAQLVETSSRLLVASSARK